jgi:hypothetical protein
VQPNRKSVSMSDAEENITRRLLNFYNQRLIDRNQMLDAIEYPNRDAIIKRMNSQDDNPPEPPLDAAAPNPSN